MRTDLLFEHFDMLADAPNAVPKLREMILQLAVMGKLVAQDPDDEPASVLLENIRAEKERLVKEGKIRKSKPLPPIKADEVPFALPAGWEWVRLNDIFNFIDYRGKTPVKIDAGIRLITAKNIRMGFITIEPEEFISEETYNEWMTRGIPKFGDILFTTEAPLANVARVTLNEKFALAQRAINFQPYKNFDTHFSKYALMSNSMRSVIKHQATGMTAKGIKGARLKLVPIPFPPETEQNRIVSKIDQLMGFCDELEAQQQKQNETRIALTDAALEKLLNPEIPAGFKTHRKRMADNFDQLFDRPETVGKLRQAILQLAVQGKLVPQDPDDEPAAVLLEKIKAEKERLIKEGKIKKSKPLPPIRPDEIPFELPEGLDLAQIENITQKLGAGSTPLGGRNVYVEKGIKFIRSQNVYNNGLKLDDIAHISPEIHTKMKGTKVMEGDILLNITGASIARCALVPDSFDEANVSQHVAIVRLVDRKIRDFIHKWLISPFIYSQIMGVQVGISREGLSMARLKAFPVPLPPVNEQKRIVKKIGHLMSLCDELEAQLTQSQSDCDTVLAAIVNNVQKDTF